MNFQSFLNPSEKSLFTMSAIIATFHSLSSSNGNCRKNFYIISKKIIIKKTNKSARHNTGFGSRKLYLAFFSAGYFNKLRSLRVETTRIFSNYDTVSMKGL